MANSLSTLAPAQLIARRILDTLLAEYPFLTFIGADFSDENAEFGRAIKVQTPTGFTAGTYTRASGYAMVDAAQTEKSLTIDKHPYVTYGFDDQERSSTAIPLVERFAQAGAAAIGTAMVNDLMALITAGNFANVTTKALASFTRTDVIATATALTGRLVPSVGRCLLLNSPYYAKLCDDASLVANAGSPSDTVRSGQLGNVHGFRVWEFAQLPTTGNLTGVAIAPGALLMASRIPTPPDAGTFNGQISTVTDDKSGLSLQVRTWYDPLKGLEYRTFTLMHGVAVGDPARLQRITSA